MSVLDKVFDDEDYQYHWEAAKAGKVLRVGSEHDIRIGYNDMSYDVVFVNGEVVAENCGAVEMLVAIANHLDLPWTIASGGPDDWYSEQE